MIMAGTAKKQRFIAVLAACCLAAAAPPADGVTCHGNVCVGMRCSVKSME